MTETTTDLVPAASHAAELRTRMDFARAMATAGILPSAYRNQPGNLLLADQYARDLALPLTTILTDIHVIEGKPAASAGLISALVRRAGHKLRTTLQRDENGNPISATATIIRHDDPEFPFVATFTLADAVRANLCQLRDGRPYARSDRSGKVLPWEAYPGALLKARAVSACARDACQEALLGVQYTPEELGAVVDEEGTPVSGPTVPPRPVPSPPPEPVEAEVVDETTGEVLDDAGWPTYNEAQPTTTSDPATDAPAAKKPGRLTDDQRVKILALFSSAPKKLTREQRIDFYRGFTGRDDIGTTNDLTKAEANRLIDYIESKEAA